MSEREYEDLIRRLAEAETDEDRAALGLQIGAAILSSLDRIARALERAASTSDKSLLDCGRSAG